jgi:hypothetical protein
VPLRRRKDRVPFLSEAWCRLFEEETRDLPTRPGVTGRFEITVTTTAGGPRPFTVELDEGAVASVALGTDPDAGLRAEFTEDDFADYLRGMTETIYRGYWVGRVRVTGDMAVTAAIAPLLDRDDFKAACRRIYDRTEFATGTGSTTAR